MLLLCSPLYSQAGLSQGNWDMRKGPREGAGAMSMTGDQGLTVFALFHSSLFSWRADKACWSQEKKKKDLARGWLMQKAPRTEPGIKNTS